MRINSKKNLTVEKKDVNRDKDTMRDRSLVLRVKVKNKD